MKPTHAIYAALGFLVLNFLNNTVSILYGSILAAYLIWLARPEYLTALFLLHLDRSNFILSGYGSWEHSVQRFFDNAVIIAGFPITITYIIAGTVFLRVFYELFKDPETFRRPGLSWLFVPWLIGLVLAAIMTFQAFVLRNPSWTINIRMFMLLGCIFYGAIIMRKWRTNGDWLILWLVPILGFLYLLAAFGRFHHPFIWIFTGMALPLSWLAIRHRSLWGKGSGIFCSCTAFFYASGLSPGMAAVGVREDLAGGLMGTGSSTFTLNALILLSILVSLILLLPKGALRSYLASLMGLPAFFVIITFSITIAILSPKYNSVGSAGWNLKHTDMTPIERFKSKLFDDRSIVWHGMLMDLLEKDPILRPAGTLVYINHPRVGTMAWQPGAHNSFFEAMRVHRWIGGPIVILFIFIVMIRCAKVVSRPLPSSLRAVAAGLIAVSIISNTSGSSPISGEGAFYYFTFAGIILSAISEMKFRNIEGTMPVIPLKAIPRQRLR